MPAVLLLVAALTVASVVGEITVDIGLGTSTDDCELDLTFLVDGSSSICENTDKCLNWASVIKFIRDIVTELDIGPSATKVAFVKYGDQADLRWNLDGYTNKTDLLAAIALETIPRGELHNSSSLGVLVDKVYVKSLGDRENALNVVVLITDNAAISLDECEKASKALQNASNLKMMVVGLTTTTYSCADECGRRVSSYPNEKGNTYFLAKKYSLIGNVKTQVLDNLCDYVDIDDYE